MRLLLSGSYLLIHLSLLGLFAIGLSARFVHPQTTWWPQPLAVVLPLLALALAVLTITALLFGRWILFAVSLIALLIFAFRYTDGFRRSSEAAGDVMTVASLNTEGGVHSMEGGDRGIPVLMQALDPEVLCLQEFSVDYRGDEARTYGDVELLFEAEGYEIIAPRRVEGHRRPPPIVTRAAFEQSSVHGLPSRYQTGAAGTVVRAQLSWNGRSFVVYNVHLQGYSRTRPWDEGQTFRPRAWIRFLRRSGAAFAMRAVEAEAIREMLASEELPYLLCGDFNTTPHQWVYGKLANGLQDGFLAGGGFWGPTYPARRPLVRIDYILASKHWRVLMAEVGPKLPPDHRPVVVRLQLPD